MTLALLAARDAAPLPMPWSRIKRVLDSRSARFVRGALRLQEARVRALEPLVERVLETGLVPALIPLEGDFPAMVADFAAEVLVEGLVHASADVRAEEQRARSAGVNLKVDGEPVVPKDAVAFLESRRDLARFFDPDQVQKVRTILGNSLREGATVKQTMDALQTALPAASRARLENIARTEATAAYNQGRVYRFLQSQGFIVAVQFMATLDSRVTDICQHRNGLVFSLKDPRIRENTPPLHFQCRSILSPVSGYKLQKMGGQERLDKDARAMDDAPGVQVTKKGRFGNEPWPDSPGGAAPVPRAKPVGPRAGGGDPRARGALDSIKDDHPEPSIRPAGDGDTPPPRGEEDWIAEFHRLRAAYFEIPEGERTPEHLAEVGRPLREEIERRAHTELRAVRQAKDEAYTRSSRADESVRKQEARYKSTKTDEDYVAEIDMKSAKDLAESRLTEFTDAKEFAIIRNNKELLRRVWSGEEFPDEVLYHPSDMPAIEAARARYGEAVRLLGEAEARLLEVRRKNPEFRRLDELRIAAEQARRDDNDARLAFGQEQSKIVMSVASRVREFGGEQFRYDLHSSKASELIPTLQEAARFYPTDWLKASNLSGKLTLNIEENKIAGIGGYYKDIAGSICFDPGDTSIAVHECGHRMEKVVRGVEEMAKRFHAQRTAGWTMRKSVDPRGEELLDYPGSMWTDYASRVYLSPDGTIESTEVMSAGVQDLLFSEDIWLNHLDRKPRAADFILGVLTTL